MGIRERLWEDCPLKIDKGFGYRNKLSSVKTNQYIEYHGSTYFGMTSLGHSYSILIPVRDLNILHVEGLNDIAAVEQCPKGICLELLVLPAAERRGNQEFAAQLPHSPRSEAEGGIRTLSLRM
jgi:hypothetical protein